MKAPWNVKFELKNAVHISRQIISGAASHSDTVVDATCGRGHDTLYLAQLVGSEGMVYSFDIQQDALENAQNLLHSHNLAQRVRFIHDDHAHIKAYVNIRIKAAMFNLGYLPGGDHQITTRVESTIKAVIEIMNLLTVGGIITIVAYPGHQPGERELQALRGFLHVIPQQQFDIIEVVFLNQINQPPELIVIQKVKEA